MEGGETPRSIPVSPEMFLAYIQGAQEAHKCPVAEDVVMYFCLA